MVEWSYKPMDEQIFVHTTMLIQSLSSLDIIFANRNVMFHVTLGILHDS